MYVFTFILFVQSNTIRKTNGIFLKKMLQFNWNASVELRNFVHATILNLLNPCDINVV